MQEPCVCGGNHIHEAVSVKKANYSWGKMVTVHHGADTSYPLHPEHQEAIKKLKSGESTSFKDETNRHVTASREGDQVHLSAKGSNRKTTVAHSHFTEGTMNTFSQLRNQLIEKTLTPAEKKKREEVAKAIERDKPGMPMGMKMAIATKTAKRVAENIEEFSEESLTAGKRLISKHGEGSHTVRVYKDTEYNEYQVHHYKDGKHMGEGPVSYHDDKADAEATAKQSIKRGMKEESEHVDEAVVKQAHKVLVTVSDPNHTMVSKRNDTMMKRVVVQATDKGEARAKAESFYKKKGFKVHGSEYHSVQPASTLKTEDVELEEAKGLAGMSMDQLKQEHEKVKSKIESEGKSKMISMNHPLSQRARSIRLHMLIKQKKQTNEEVEQIDERVETTHEDPLVTVHDKDGLHTHANLSVANRIFQTNVKHTDVHKGPVTVNSGHEDKRKLKFAISMHHAQAVKDDKKFRDTYGEGAELRRAHPASVYRSAVAASNKQRAEILKKKTQKPAPQASQLKNIKEDVDQDREDQHYCAKHVRSQILGDGIVLEAQHADPDEDGNIEWYLVEFKDGIRKVYTEDLEIMLAEFHGNHKKKKKAE